VAFDFTFEMPGSYAQILQGGMVSQFASGGGAEEGRSEGTLKGNSRQVLPGR